MRSPASADAVGPRSLIGMIALALVTACSGSSGGEAATTTSAATTAAPTVTTTATTHPTTIATTPATTTVTTTGASPTTIAPPNGPTGSGCTPGDAVVLSEGEWYGVVVSTSPSGIEFDLACWFTGEAAVVAAAEDGAEPPPNDYYVRNENPQVRSLSVSGETEVIWYPTGDPSSEIMVTFADWVEGANARGLFFDVWLEIIDGEVFRIREQWVP
jgi:hypothetical protein